MVETTIEIIGLPKLIQFLNQGAPSKLKQGVNDGLSDLGNQIQNVTTGLCPVDTGALQGSIDISSTEDSITAHVGEDYASYVDEGTSRMSAQPFFTRPIEGIVAGLNAAVEAALSRTGLFSE